SSDNYRSGLAQRFGSLIHPRFEQVRAALADYYKADLLYPQTVEALTQVLRGRDVDWTELRDPWGMPYQPRLRAAGRQVTLEWISSGPDKKPGTNDDFVANHTSWSYFAYWERKIKS